MSKSILKYIKYILVIPPLYIIGRVLIKLSTLNSANMQIWTSLVMVLIFLAIFYFFKRPIYALSSYFVFSPFINNLRFNIQQLALPAYFPELLLLIGIILLGLIQNGKQLKELWDDTDKVFLFYVAFFSLAMVLSAVFSSYPESSVDLLPLYFTGFLLFPAIILIVKNEQDVKIVFYGMILGGLLGCLYAGNKLIALGVGFSFNVFNEGKELFNSIRSLYGHPSYFQLALVVCLPLQFYFITKENNKYIKTALYVTISIFLFFIMISYERGGWLSAAVVLVFILMLKENRSKPILFMLLSGFILMLPFIVSYFSARVKSIAFMQQDYNLKFRYLGWWAALKMIYYNPVFGVGLGVFRDNFVKYAGVWTIYGDLWHAHNMFLNIAAENGLFGIIPFISMIIRFYRKEFKSLMGVNKLSYYMIVSMGAFLLFSSTTATVFVDFQYNNMTTSNYLWAMFGIMNVLANDAKK